MRVGGGIFILGGATITNNHIINNNLLDPFSPPNGGGIYIDSKYPVPYKNRNVIIKTTLLKTIGRAVKFWLAVQAYLFSSDYGNNPNNWKAAILSSGLVNL